MMARPLFLKASHDREFKDSAQAQTHLAYVAAEIKTNLDKTKRCSKRQPRRPTT